MTDGAVRHIQSLIQLGRTDEALVALAPLMAASPDDPELHGLSGQARLMSDDASGALAAGNRLVALLPEEEWGHRICALALRAQGRYPEATVAAAEAIRLDPLNAAIHQTYALAARHVPHLVQDARLAILRALELQPHESSHHVVLGVIHEVLYDLDGARTSYREALRLEPQNSTAMTNLIRLDGAGRLRRYAPGFASALAVDPNSTYSRNSLDEVVTWFASRLVLISLLGMVACLAVCATTGWQVTAYTAFVGIAALTAVPAYAISVKRGLPMAVVEHAKRRFVRQPHLLADLSVVVLAMGTTALASLVGVGEAVSVGLMTAVGLASICALVWAVILDARE